jgi:plastocyanin
MKLFTRLVAVFALLVTPAVAATVTVEVGDNFYRSMTSGTSTITMAAGDELVFRNVGAGSHPTASSSSPMAWATFTISPATTTKTFAPNTFAPGTYPFYCIAHGTPTSGQTGLLIVTGTPTNALDARTTGISLNLFPNPSRGQITVQLSQKAGIDCKLRISNIIGQELRSIALKPELTTAGLPVDLSSLRAGIYFYSLLVDGKVVTTKRLVLQD